MVLSLRLKTLKERVSVTLLFAFTAMLTAACGGGSSSGNSSALGAGQDPDPVVVDFPIAYVKRPILLDDDGNLLQAEVRNAVDFRPGAELFLRDRAAPSAAETSLTFGVFPDDVDGNPPLYDVKDLSVSYDGLQLVFAMRAPEIPNVDDDEQPTWNIWLYDRETGLLDRVIESDITAEDGQDVAPRFLPDGRIVYTSTRQRLSKAILLDEGKPQFSGFDEDRDNPALTLHVMNSEDGSEIQQISFNQSSDLDPAVMGDGRVVFSRWDNVAGIDRLSLYRSNPDGTEMEMLYGIHSHDTGPDGEIIEFVETTELPDGRLMAMMRPTGNQFRMGSVPVAIDVTAYVEHDQPTTTNAGLLSDAQEFLISAELSLDENAPVLAGRYASIVPLFDGTNRIISSWSQCRLTDTTSDPLDPTIAPCTDEFLQDPNFVEADPLYGIWMNNLDDDTQQPIVVAQAGEVYSEVVVFEGKTNPPVILDKTAGIDLDPDLVSESVGVLHIRSVYDFDGIGFDGTDVVDINVLRDPVQTLAADRPARFLRIVKAVAMPDDDLVDLDNTAFGRSNAQLMREVIGYAPVEPDGSVKVKVPANIAFWTEVLDVNGQRIFPRHQNWMQVRPGEEKECVGCHTSNSQMPHGRPGAQALSINDGAPTDGSPFPNTEPALFANAGETMAEVVTRINGIPNPNVNIAYDDVWTDPAVRAKDVSLLYSYSDLSTSAPVDPACVTNWNAACRIVVNYETHIHPIWSVDRQEFDGGGALIADNTCTSCHGLVDAAAAAQVPAAQLDLSDGASDQEADHFKSYRELLFPDNELELDANGNVIERVVQDTDANGNPLFLLDANGNQVLDANGDPIPVLVPVAVGNVALSTVGAAFSPSFFSLFNGGSHTDRLSEAELKLITEWIDVGGQYYNNPFDVPQ